MKPLWLWNLHSQRGFLFFSFSTVRVSIKPLWLWIIFHNQRGLFFFGGWSPYRCGNLHSRRGSFPSPLNSAKPCCAREFRHPRELQQRLASLNSHRSLGPFSCGFHSEHFLHATSTKGQSDAAQNSTLHPSSESIKSRTCRVGGDSAKKTAGSYGS